MLIGSVLNQVVYPEAGDVDDCWVIACIMAARASDPTIRLPTVTEFRRAAGDPDDGTRDGGSAAMIELRLAIPKLWPEALFAGRVRYLQRAPWFAFLEAIDAGGIATTAVDSAKLLVRYGFFKAHQVVFFRDGTTYRVANPLAPNGSRPTAISAEAMHAAVTSYGGGFAYAAVFPNPEEVPVSGFRTESKVIISGSVVDTIPPTQLHSTAGDVVRTIKSVIALDDIGVSLGDGAYRGVHVRKAQLDNDPDFEGGVLLVRRDQVSSPRQRTPAELVAAARELGIEITAPAPPVDEDAIFNAGVAAAAAAAGTARRG